jgi:CheY-like chemotaxis protein
MRNLKPILLVEDDDVDAMTVEHVLKDLKVTNHVFRSNNGEEALDYLRNESNQKPCFILLDLNMPKMNGIEFLKAIKSDEELKNIPVIVLTTSDEQQDIVESFNLHAAGYMLKSVDYKEFADTIKAIDIYWTLSKLPNRG